MGIADPIIEELVENQNWTALRHHIAAMEPFVLSELISELPDRDGVIIFRLLPRDLANETFHYLSQEVQELLIHSLADKQSRLTDLLNELKPDDRTALLEEMPGHVSQRLIQLLSPEERRIALQLLGYPEYSIGRLMTPDYVAVKPYFTINQTIEHIRLYGRESETLSVIYVVDNDWKLIDDLKIRDILMADPESSIRDVMDNRFVSLIAFDDQETATHVFQDHDRVVLPVTDSDGILLGIVTIDDVMDVLEEEATEDFHKFGSIQDAVFNPLKASVMFLYQKRILWLFILVFMNVFSGAALSVFEHTIEALVALVFFLPLLIGSGGNAGAQSATLIIRALATGDVEPKDWFRLVGKEVMVSLLLGLTMALAVSLIASLRAPEIMVVVGLSMVCIVLIGSVIGLLLPFIFNRFRLDPATASAPLITSIADISGVLIYFSIANWYLNL
jgi:magnesium transporter